MNDERDEETGKFTSKYSPEDFIGALDELGGAGGTADVAEIVGCPDRTAYHHLSNLREEGRITSRSVGAANLWTLGDRGGDTDEDALDDAGPYDPSDEFQ